MLYSPLCIYHDIFPYSIVQSDPDIPSRPWSRSARRDPNKLISSTQTQNKMHSKPPSRITTDKIGFAVVSAFRTYPCAPCRPLRSLRTTGINSFVHSPAIAPPPPQLHACTPFHRCAVQSLSFQRKLHSLLASTTHRIPIFFRTIHTSFCARASPTHNPPDAPRPTKSSITSVTPSKYVLQLRLFCCTTRRVTNHPPPFATVSSPCLSNLNMPHL